MGDSLNVCMIGQGVHPPWNEGCAVVTRNLASNLSKYIDIFMISPIDYFRGFIKEDSDQLFRNVEYVNSNFVFKALRSRGKYFIFDQLLDVAKVHIIMNRLDSRFGIDIVHLCNISHLMCSALTDAFLKKPTVAHIFGSSGIGDTLSKNFVDAYACSSRTACSQLIDKGIQNRKVHVIPPIIDCNIYRPLSKLKIQNDLNTSDNFVLTYIGNIGDKRLPQELLLEIKEVSKIRRGLELHIYCPDMALNRKNAAMLKPFLSRSGIKHRIVVSNLKEFEKVQIYNRSNALIFPYSADAVIVDPPLAVLEAMACGKIVISSRTLSIPDFIKHDENGFLVDVGDFKGFREMISYVIGNFRELQQIGASARNTIQAIFSSDIVTNKIMKVYRSIVN